MSHDIKLYHSTGSPNARRVRIFIAEKGIAIPSVAVDLGKREQFSDWFTAINPRRQVPALTVDGVTIAEVPAIFRYLEEEFPDFPLLGSDPIDKALVAMWERRAELDGFAPAMEGIRNKAEGLKGRALSGPYDYEQIPALVDRAAARLAHFHADLDARLKTVPFIAGDHFSAADITALVAVDFAAAAMKMPVPEGLDALQVWHDAIAARPGAAA